MSDFFKRHIESKILDALRYMPVVLLRGARQTGKTNLMKSIAATRSEYTYVSLDHFASFTNAKDDPIGFISSLKKPAIIDEIQRVPELFLPIKSDVDIHQDMGRYILTGSVDPLALPKLGDSLAGRMRLLQLWPFSQGEIRKKKEQFLEKVFDGTLLSSGVTLPCSKPEILELASIGGYPRPFLMKNEEEKENWFNDYVTIILQKDVLELSKIEHVKELPNLLMMLASRAGNMLNTEELSRTMKLSTMTLHRYLSLLQMLFFLHLVPAWHKNLGKRLVKSPKIYLSDTALLLFLLHTDMSRIEKEPILQGQIVENFVVTEILKQLSWSDKRIQLYYYRDYSKAEVDIVLEGPNGDVVGIEIKSSETIAKDDFKGLKLLEELLGEKFRAGIVLYSGNIQLSFGKKLGAVPIAALWN